MVQTCGLLHYQTNSIVRHAVSTSPKGPWRDIGVALAPRPWPSWDFGNVHAPTVRYDATTKQWLLFYEATFWRHGAVDCRVNRTAPAVYVSRTRRIGVAAAASALKAKGNGKVGAGVVQSPERLKLQISMLSTRVPPH